MTVLETIAKKHLGAATLKKHPHLLDALRAGGSAVQEAEKERIASIVALCFEYERESNTEEKKNILRTLEEISANELLELPKETVEAWEQRLKKSDTGYAKAEAAEINKAAAFRKKYFSFRAKAGLTTQAEVARKSGMSRSYVAVIESGEHVPQQKTLQKLAKAFGVDVTDLIS
jgi:DNA-binding XRE family transcriptional regulator